MPTVITSTNMTTTIDLQSETTSHPPLPRLVTEDTSSALKRSAHAPGGEGGPAQRNAKLIEPHEAHCKHMQLALLPLSRTTCVLSMLLSVSLSCSSASEIESATSVPKYAQFSDSEQAETIGVGYSDTISFTELTEGLP